MYSINMPCGSVDPIHHFLHEFAIDLAIMMLFTWRFRMAAFTSGIWGCCAHIGHLVHVHMHRDNIQSRTHYRLDAVERQAPSRHYMSVLNIRGRCHFRQNQSPCCLDPG